MPRYHLSSPPLSSRRRVGAPSERLNGMPGPLHGFRVVDLTSNVAGPLGTMILGDQGADIIKVEAPDGGDATRAGGKGRAGFTASFLNNNRNKRSIVLDLKTAAGLQAYPRYQ